MIIFVEGCDGSGKSTLIKQLSERYPVMRIPRAAENFNLWNRVISMGKDDFVLMDRSPLTELIYRTWENEHSKFGYFNVLRWLSKGKVIFCKTETAFEDAQNRGEDLVTDKINAKRLSSLYDSMVSMLKTDHVRVLDYNWQENCLDDVIKFIEEV